MIGGICAMILLWPEKSNIQSLAQDEDDQKGQGKSDKDKTDSPDKQEAKPTSSKDSTPDANQKKKTEDDSRIKDLEAVLARIEEKDDFKDFKEIETDERDLKTVRKAIENPGDSYNVRIELAEQKLMSAREKKKTEILPATPLPKTYPLDPVALGIKKEDTLTFTISNDKKNGKTFIWNGKAVVPQREESKEPALFHLTETASFDAGKPYTIHLNESLPSTIMVLEGSVWRRHFGEKFSEIKFDGIKVQSNDVTNPAKKNGYELAMDLRAKKYSSLFVMMKLQNPSHFRKYIDTEVSLKQEVPLEIADRIPRWLDHSTSSLKNLSELFQESGKLIGQRIIELEDWRKQKENLKAKHIQIIGAYKTKESDQIPLIKSKLRELAGDQVELLDDKLETFFKSLNTGLNKDFVKKLELTDQQKQQRENNKGGKKPEQKKIVKNINDLEKKYNDDYKHFINKGKDFVTRVKDLNIRRENLRVMPPDKGDLRMGNFTPKPNEDKLHIDFGSRLLKLYNLKKQQKDISAFPKRFTNEQGRVLLEIVE
ncbi:MAG: hypothetical protein HN531_14920 [Opitutae bacterium]|nr:hypothetical protein [Opitutae bacterium]